METAIARSLILAALGPVAHSAYAQGGAAAIVGRVLDDHGRGLAGAQVVVTNRSTGISMRATSRAGGRYRVGGLEVGGPYSITVRRLGFAVRTSDARFLTLGEERVADVTLEQGAVLLRPVEARAFSDRVFSRAHTGAEAVLSDSTIHSLPVLNRDLYDLVRLVPQMSTGFALTVPGAGPRVNSIRIDGVTDQVPSSNLAAGALYGGKVIPLDAVKEYQVALSPFDVRYGGFAGAGVNVVTRSGTNELHGSLFDYGTNERLGANVPLIRRVPYDKQQFGFSVGGPIIEKKLLFFVSSEFQQRSIPAPGPYAGESPSSQTPLPATTADITRFQELLSARGLAGGSAGAVTNSNPSSSVFLRLDAPIQRWNSRMMVRGNYEHADSSIFARPTMLAPTDCPSSACFPLSSLQHSRWIDRRSVAAQLVSNLVHGADNELVAGYTNTVTGFLPSVRQPLILTTVLGPNGVPAVLQSGTHEIATGQRNASWTAEVTDNVSISAGTHRVTVGASSQVFSLRAFQSRGSYGVWEFSSLDALQAGTASRYRITRDTGSVTAASGAYHSVYVADEWEASQRLSLSFGLRADASRLRARPPYVPAIDSTFHSRTDDVPSGLVAWSPRVGFNYAARATSGEQAQVRGGVGIFTGRPPLFWLFGGFAAYGLAARTLQCGALTGDAGPAPPFHGDYRNPPLACAGGETFAASSGGEIDVIDPKLRLPQQLRASLAVDAQLPLGVVGTIEGMYTRATQAVFFVPINLAGPVSTDRFRRVMYGTIDASGTALPRRVSSTLGDVISITHESKDRAADVTGELRRVGRVVDLDASISHGSSRDVQSPRVVSALLTDNWRYGRPVAGRENDQRLGTSDFDQPWRVRASSTVHSPWRRFATDVSLSYVGGSGYPYTYVAGGTPGLGDLNADGAVGNDPIYIPRAASDTSEIRFGGSPADVAAQQAALDRFIDGAACLRRQRGRIMVRNSCRSPWMSSSYLALRQTMPSVGAQSFAMEVQVFNLLNLLNPHWGRAQLPTGASFMTTSQVPLLSQTGEITGSGAQPIYRFDPAMRRFTDENFDTYYQVQLALRYIF